MNNSLRLSCGVLMLLALSSANAATPDSITVKTEVENACTFVTPNIVATIPPVLGDTVVGNVGFSCNYVGFANLNLTVPGGTFLTSGPNKVRYQIKWDLEDPVANFQYSPNPVPSITFGLSAQTAMIPNNSVSGPVTIRLDQVPTIAGTYTSVATFTFAP
jgi:hypothetical protein